MGLNITLFKFPGLRRVFCAFQGKSPQAGKQPGNISFHTGDDPADALANRKALFAALTPHGLRGWAECTQVHGKELLAEPPLSPLEAGAPDTARADGMMSAEPGKGLLIKTADCQPLLIAHNSGKYVMALHVGWRGNRINFIGAAIARFCDIYDLARRDLLAVRGPSLGPAMAEFINFDREWGHDFLPWLDPPTMCMDLWRLTRSQLEKAGLDSRNIFELDICTALNSDKFFSYRKDRQCGRQGSLIWIAA